MRVYGTRDANNGSYSPAQQSQQSQQRAASATAETSEETGTSGVNGSGRIGATAGGGGSHSTTPMPSGTPQNTPAPNSNNRGEGNGANDEGGSNVLLCPRGLAAIPLLCAAASESRSAYLARLQVTHPSNGVS